VSRALVLVTRPRPEAEETAARIQAMGHSCLIEPMLEIVPMEGPALDLGGVQALLVTSRNGARALAARTMERALRVFAVGGATASVLADLGFAHVEAAEGTGLDLAERVRERCAPAGGALLHVRGSDVAADPLPLLRAAGFETRSAVLYEVRTPSAFSPHLERTMRQRAIGYALFFSPRTAQAFVRLADAAGLGPACGDIEACCLSAAVATGLEGVGWRAVRVSVRPRQEALLALLPSR
jgi:uroporphyrinogen-III synthase